jgi:hypothetical protein
MATCIKCTKFETTLDNELCNACMGVVPKSSKPAWMSEKGVADNIGGGNKKIKVNKKLNKSDKISKSDKVKPEKSKKDFNLTLKIKKALKPLLIVSLISTIIIAAIFTFIKLSPDEIQQGLIVQTETQSTNSFGLAIRLDRVNTGNKYDKALSPMVFKVGCEANIDKHLAVAFTISAEASALYETVLITSAEELSDCITDKKAFISDGISSLPVTIKSYDESKSVLLLQAAITLPILAHTMIEDDKILFYTIKDNQLQEITPELEANLPAGSPIINAIGESFAINLKKGDVKIKELCAGLFTC